MTIWTKVAALAMFTGTLTLSAQTLMAAPHKSRPAATTAADDNMTKYRNLAGNTLTAFKNHDMPTAKKTAKELEKAWDDDTKALKKNSPDVWNQIDKAMDDFIQPAQDKSSDPAKVQATYDTFIAKLQLAVK